MKKIRPLLIIIIALALAQSSVMAAPTERPYTIVVDGIKHVGRLLQNVLGNWLVWIDCGNDPFATGATETRREAQQKARDLFPTYTRAADCPA